MKKAVISGIMVVLVILGIGISYMQFQGKALQGKNPSKDEQKSMEENDKRMENLMLPGQEGEIDERSEAFAKELQEKAGLTVDPKNIASVGSPITSGNHSFTVDSWRVSKESPGYELPEGMDFNAYGDFHGIKSAVVMVVYVTCGLASTWLIFRKKNIFFRRKAAES